MPKSPGPGRFPLILPRLNQFRKFNPYILGLNFALKKWYAKSGGSCAFIPSYRSFLTGGGSREELFAKDGLHLNGAGVVMCWRHVSSWPCWQSTSWLCDCWVNEKALWTDLQRTDCCGGFVGLASWGWPLFGLSWNTILPTPLELLILVRV